MSDQTYLPSPDQPDRPVATPPHAPSGARDRLPLLCGVGFLVLAIAILLVWLFPNPSAELQSAVADLHGAQQRLADVDARLSRLEQRPAPASASDLAKLASDQAKMSSRLEAMEGRVGDPAQLGVRLDALSGRVEALSGRSQSGIEAAEQQTEAVKQQVNGLSGRISAVEKASGTLSSLTDRLNRLARLQEAGLALSAGKAVGDLPHAPAALARFAHQAPPTEAQLRLAFPQAQRAALAAEQAGDEKAPFADRVWERAQGLVTVRRGDDLMVGNPSATALSTAKAALDAGDLPGAVAAVNTLSGPPRQAMDDWVTQATALINARLALADMAGQG